MKTICLKGKWNKKKSYTGKKSFEYKDIISLTSFPLKINLLNDLYGFIVFFFVVVGFHLLVSLNKTNKSIFINNQQKKHQQTNDQMSRTVHWKMSEREFKSLIVNSSNLSDLTRLWILKLYIILF